MLQSGLYFRLAFSSPSLGGTNMNPVVQLLDGILGIFSLVLFVWCLLSWFPNINMYDQPWRTLDRIIRPVLTPLQRIIPPVGNIDLSPMVLLFALQFVQRIVHSFL